MNEDAKAIVLIQLAIDWKRHHSASGIRLQTSCDQNSKTGEPRRKNIFLTSFFNFTPDILDILVS